MEKGKSQKVVLKVPNLGKAYSSISYFTFKSAQVQAVKKCTMIDFIIFGCIIISSIWLVKKCLFSPTPRFVALDTEMVGAGFRGSVNMVARVSVVNMYGQVIYDEYVKPTAPVTDYRTPWSGIRPMNFAGAKDFYSVRQEVAGILKDSILIGHDVKIDLGVLELHHPEKDIRDTAFYLPFRQRSGILGKPSLKFLAKAFLSRYIQLDEHSSVEDAQAAMDLYLLVKEQWK